MRLLSVATATLLLAACTSGSGTVDPEVTTAAPTTASTPATTAVPRVHVLAKTFQSSHSTVTLMDIQDTCGAYGTVEVTITGFDPDMDVTQHIKIEGGQDPGGKGELSNKQGAVTITLGCKDYPAGSYAVLLIQEGSGKSATFDFNSYKD